MRLVLAVMMKNEEDVIEKTLLSIVDFVDFVVLFDTGSTDSTIPLCKRIMKERNVPGTIIEGEFVDFSTSRNRLLEEVEKRCSGWWCITLDANDEVTGAGTIKGFLDKISSKIVAFHVPVFWGGKRLEMVRLFRVGYGLKYKGRIHEVLDVPAFPPEYLPKQLAIFQDRTKDSHKTLKRHERDIRILEEELEEDPENKRNIFYMAHTFCALGRYEQAEEWYRKRISYGDVESDEVFLSDFYLDKILSIKDGERNPGRLDKLKLKYKNRPEFSFELYCYWIRTGELSKAKEEIKCCCKTPYPENATFCVDDHLLKILRWEVLLQTLEKDETNLVEKCNREIEDGKKFFRESLGEDVCFPEM